jgi:broad-specificity NMP kinase
MPTVSMPPLTVQAPGLANVRRMTRVLVTGMSGAGKSTALAELARRGHRVVDTDHGGWVEEFDEPEGPGVDRRWRQEVIGALLAEPVEGNLFVSGTVSNQGRFYPRFDAIVLLTAPLEVLLARVASRQTNEYGKAETERAEIIHYVATIEPLLRAGATAEIDTRAPVSTVADQLELIARLAS